MENLFKPDMTLQQMNKILERYCFDSNGKTVLATKAIPLTYEDYRLMKDRLDNFINFNGDASGYFDVQLSIIITWIFAEKFHQKDLSKTFIQSLMTLPQHHFKSYIDMMASTMIEYNLETFGEDYEELSGLCNIIHKHAFT